MRGLAVEQGSYQELAAIHGLDHEDHVLFSAVQTLIMGVRSQPDEVMKAIVSLRDTVLPALKANTEERAAAKKKELDELRGIELSVQASDAKGSRELGVAQGNFLGGTFSGSQVESPFKGIRRHR